MKIFISHSSKNANFGNALVDLLTGIGISGDHVIFTSNDAYGIPIGQNIFNWLKSTIVEKPHVLYLLSPEYYSSIACLNEMGAAWVVENEHTMIFTPNFNLNSYEFQNGALDPREIGFRIDNEDRLIAFVDSLRKSFDISNNPVRINQKIREFIERIHSFKTEVKTEAFSLSKPKEIFVEEEVLNLEEDKSKETLTFQKSINGSSRLFSDLMDDKLKDEEVLLVHYIIETAKYKLGTGWQESHEIDNIKTWEDINELDDTLSNNYANAIRRFEMRKFIEVSDLTSHGNPKEVSLLNGIQEELLSLPKEINEKISEIVSNHAKKGFWF